MDAGRGMEGSNLYKQYVSDTTTNAIRNHHIQRLSHIPTKPQLPANFHEQNTPSSIFCSFASSATSGGFSSITVDSGGTSAGICKQTQNESFWDGNYANSVVAFKAQTVS